MKSIGSKHDYQKIYYNRKISTMTIQWQRYLKLWFRLNKWVVNVRESLRCYISPTFTNSSSWSFQDSLIDTRILSCAALNISEDEFEEPVKSTVSDQYCVMISFSFWNMQNLEVKSNKTYAFWIKRLALFYSSSSLIARACFGIDFLFFIK